MNRALQALGTWRTIALRATVAAQRLQLHGLIEVAGMGLIVAGFALVWVPGAGGCWPRGGAVCAGRPGIDRREEQLMSEPTKAPPRRVPSDDFTTTVGAEEYHPHAGEWVEFIGRPSVGDSLRLMKVLGLMAELQGRSPDQIGDARGGDKEPGSRLRGNTLRHRGPAGEGDHGLVLD